MERYRSCGAVPTDTGHGFFLSGLIGLLDGSLLMALSAWHGSASLPSELSGFLAHSRYIISVWYDRASPDVACGHIGVRKETS